ncbi:MAG: hypothetical protein WC473_01775 [Patescibacteria group bacterium]
MKLYNPMILLGVIFCCFYFFCPLRVSAQDPATAFETQLGEAKTALSQAEAGLPAKQALAMCEALKKAATAIPCGFYDCSAKLSALAEAQTVCNKYVSDNSTGQQIEADLKAEVRKAKNQDRWKKFLNALSNSASKALDTLLRSVTREATKIAFTALKGQKPAYITEGWNAYLLNAADSALGDFIDNFSQHYGVDICQPDLQVQLLINIQLGRTAPRVRCTFSEIMTNWQEAVTNPTFPLEYTLALRPGENDITASLLALDLRDLAVNQQVKSKTYEASTNQGWLSKVTFNGKILTPGTMLHDMMTDAMLKKGNSQYSITWTETAMAVPFEFMDTVVAESLGLLKEGLFSLTQSSSGGSSGGSSNPLTSQGSNILSGALTALFNPSASPIITEGTKGAEERINNAISGSQGQQGGKVDLIVGLSSCDDSSKTNPGPMDCIIDGSLAQVIKSKTYVIDLPDQIKNRVFSPRSEQSNSLQTAIPYRSILVLRQYRIVPVGWEEAANLIRNSNSNREYTLGELINCYEGLGKNGCTTNSFKGMVDPYWTLKAYETSCRRQGYGALNLNKDDQSGTIGRLEYCSDEQQCLQEDENGACLAYGYCNEERRIWDLGKTCPARVNSCQTYTSRTGGTSSYLTNTLDFRNCNAQVAGCRWYAIDYNPSSQTWTNLGSGTQLTPPEAVNQVITFSRSDRDWWIQAGHQVSANSRLRLASPCSSDMCKLDVTGKGCVFHQTTGGNYCSFQYSEAIDQTSYAPRDPSCNVPDNGVSCQLRLCNDAKLFPDVYTAEVANKPNLGLEGLLNSQEGWKAASWTLAFIDNNNRHLRVTTEKHSGVASLFIKTLYAPADLISYEPAIPVEKNTNYNVRFYYKGSINGSVNVEVRAGSKGATSFDQDSSLWPSLLNNLQLTSGSSGWRETNLNFNSGDNEQIILVVRNPAGVYADLYLDDFEFYPISTACGVGAVSVLVSSREGATEMYFDRDAQTCSSLSDGCSQFIRTKSNLGGNVVINGGFDGTLYDWSNLILADNTRAKISYLSGLDSANINKTIQVTPGQYYFLAIDGYQISVDQATLIETFLRFKSKAGAVLPVATSSATCEWAQDKDGNIPQTLALKFTPTSFATSSRFFCKFKAPDNAARMELWFSTGATGQEAIIDNVKTEAISFNATYPSIYSDYNPAARSVEQVAYLKKAPDYFSCYDAYPDIAGLQWPQNQQELTSVLKNKNANCARYAGVCTPQEVGCELYRPVNGDPSIPGVAQDFDACPKECAGYQLYNQEKTSFINQAFRQFIADSKLKTCSANYAGCDEFTNLDTAGQGGEQKEYYSQIQACQKPSVDDGAYYTWEGSDITGYQLVAFSLKKSQVASDPETAGVGQGTAPCTNLIYNASGNAVCNDSANTHGAEAGRYDFGVCTKDDMVSNPDCRELYDVDGNIHYRLLSRTVSVSNNCHPYRRTMTETSFTEAKANCESHSGWWNGSNECIYMAIPGQGKICPANAQGCRAYTGNRGNNIKNAINVVNFTASSTALDLWEDANGGRNGLFISSESTFPGGNSLSNKVNNPTIHYPITIQKNKAYTLSFWAKGNASYYLDNIRFVEKSGINWNDNSAANGNNYFSASRLLGENLINPRTQLTEEWKRYELGPLFVTWEPGDGNYLEFSMPNGQVVYLDNIILKEITNQVYAIENSWFTPLSCDNKLDDPDGNKAKTEGVCQDTQSGRCSIGEMLGCAGYLDRKNKVSYLRSFASLCRPEAAGCEALIDTFNSSAPQAQSFNIANSVNHDDIFVATDTLVYLVNYDKYSCAKGDKGCTRYGLPLIDKWDEITGYRDIYVKNDPDRYSTDLCSAENLWCEEWAGNNTLIYFKDPHGKVCQFTSSDSSNGLDKWFKSGTVETCPTTYQQTLGLSYKSATDKLQPLGPINAVTLQAPSSPAYSGWVGACSTEQSGCSEYIDPLENLASNLIPQRCEGQDTCVDVSIKKNILYVLSDNIKVGDIICSDVQGVSNSFSDNLGHYLYLAVDNPKSLTCRVTFKTQDGSSIDLVRDKVGLASVSYILSSKVSSGDCNGQVDYHKGCVLFNDRSQLDYSNLINSATTSLSFSSRLTRDNNYPQGINGLSRSVPPAAVTEAGKPKDANIILKSQPNRACANWLTCSTFEKKEEGQSSTLAPYFFSDQDSCLEVGACNSLGDNGICNNYLANDAVSSDQYSPSLDANKSGFSRVGYYSFDAMTQVGQSSNVVNGNFEEAFGATTQPLGWRLAVYYCASNSDCAAGNPDVVYKNWQASYTTIGRDGAKAKDGVGYLKINSGWGVISESVDILPNQDYFLSAWVHTKDLQGPGVAGRLPYAELRLRFINSKGQPRPNLAAVDGGVYEGDWVKGEVMQTPTGLPWKQVIVHFRTGDNVSGVQLALFNMNPDGSKGIDNSKLGGYTLWDNVNLKPLLKSSASGYIDRTCRVYPSMNAPACKYNDGNNYFYGQYGYCLTPDPANNQQCLQWWPVDSIRGETLSDFSSYYSERYPLYYCLEKKTMILDVSQYTGNFGLFGEGVNESGMESLKFDTNAKQTKATSFNISPTWSPLFRYPFIYKFQFDGIFIAIGDTASHTLFGGVLSVGMWKNLVCAKPLGIIPLPICYVPSGNGLITTSDGTGVTTPAQEEVQSWVQGNTNGRVCEYSVLATLNDSSYGGGLKSCQCDSADEADSSTCRSASNCSNTIAAFSSNNNCITADLAENYAQSIKDYTYLCEITAEPCSCESGAVNCEDSAHCSNPGTNKCAKVFIDSGASAGAAGVAQTISQQSQSLNDAYGSCRNAGEDCGGQTSSFWTNIWSGIKEFFGSLFASVGNLLDIVFAPNSLNLTDDDSWGGWGAVAVAGYGQLLSFVPVNIVLHIELPWHTAKKFDTSGGVLGNLAGMLIQAAGVDLGISTFGLRIITDEDSEFGKNLTDPNPTVTGDVLGFAKFLDFNKPAGMGDKMGGISVVGNFAGKQAVEYCSKLVQVVNSGNENKAWASRLSPGSQYLDYLGRDCVKDSSISGDAIPSGVGIVTPSNDELFSDGCFYSSAYCLAESRRLYNSNGELLGYYPLNLCQNFVGIDNGQGVNDPDDPTRKLYCAEGVSLEGRQRTAYLNQANALNCQIAYNSRPVGDSSDNNYFQVHSFAKDVSLMTMNDCRINYKYFCVDDRDFGATGIWREKKLIYRRIYAAVGYNYTTDYKPFGSMVAPENGQYPNEWDTRPDSGGSQPIFYEFPGGNTPPYQARAGQKSGTSVYYIDNFSVNKPDLLQLFGRSYSLWQWQADKSSDPLVGHYTDITGTTGSSNSVWSLPTLYCPDNSRPTNTYLSFCLVRPEFTLAQVNPTIVNSIGAVKVSFNSKIDPDQVPIRSYDVDWGDGNVSSYAGLSLASRPTSSNAFNLYHFYNYDSLANKNLRGCETKVGILLLGDGTTETVEEYSDDLTKGACQEPLRSASNPSAFHVPIKLTVRDNWASVNSIIIKDLIVLRRDTYDAEQQDAIAECKLASYSSALGQQCSSGNPCCSATCYWLPENEVNLGINPTDSTQKTCCATYTGGWRRCREIGDGYCDIGEQATDPNASNYSPDDCGNIVADVAPIDYADGVCPETKSLDDDIDCPLGQGSLVTLANDSYDWKAFMAINAVGGGCGGVPNGEYNDERGESKGNFNFNADAELFAGFSASSSTQYFIDLVYSPNDTDGDKQLRYGDILRLVPCFQNSTYGSGSNNCPASSSVNPANTGSIPIISPIKLNIYRTQPTWWQQLWGTDPGDWKAYLDTCGADGDAYFKVCQNQGCDGPADKVGIGDRVVLRVVTNSAQVGDPIAASLYDVALHVGGEDRSPVFLNIEEDSSRPYRAAELNVSPSLNLRLCNRYGNCGY